MGNFSYYKRPGLTRAEITAYNCGKRLQREQDDSISTFAGERFLPHSILTVEELREYTTCNLDRWWLAWWHGWNDAMEEDS
jgi:hypothetical protein